MSEVASTFTGVGVSSNLDLPAKGENVTYTFSGGTDVIHQLEKEAGSPGSGSWQIVLGPYTDDDNSDSPVTYTTPSPYSTTLTPEPATAPTLASFLRTFGITIPF